MSRECAAISTFDCRQYDSCRFDHDAIACKARVCNVDATVHDAKLELLDTEYEDQDERLRRALEEDRIIFD